ncbi:MAG: sugar transferase [Chloroflexi bacterium]|nr:sugar transferase [Chloroflexota bacterium]
MNFAVFSIVMDMALSLLAFLVAVVIRPSLDWLPYIISGSSYREFIHPTLYAVVPVLWVMTFITFSVYDPKRIYKAADESQNVIVSSGIASLIFAGILYLFVRDFSRWLFVVFNVLNLIFLLGWRMFIRLVFRFRKSPLQKRRVLIVGAGEVGQRVGNMICDYDWAGLHLVGYLDDKDKKSQKGLMVLGSLDETRRIVADNEIDDVVIALPQRIYGKINHLIFTLHDLPVHVRVVPDYFSLALYRASVEDFSGIPMINMRDPALNDVQRLVKRLFDLTLGSLLTICVLPIIGSIALFIRLDSKDPVIFRQKRIGENGRSFSMYKFRTMIVGAERLEDKVKAENGNGDMLDKRPDDPRVTNIGRLLRKTSLDELPQLFNVLKGDMSLVGPRPELPWMVTQYEPWQHKRFAVPQGMTGWWQVNGRSDTSYEERVTLDMAYIENWSVWEDIKILIKTVPAVFRGHGAY